jgi:hypothetical protein
MRYRLRMATARLLVLAMMLTFLCPQLGWQMLASHDELEHVLASGDHDSHPHHDHENDAHGFLGHLLTHMPLIYTETATAAPVQRSAVEGRVLRIALHGRVADPPFIPPRLPFQS